MNQLKTNLPENSLECAKQAWHILQKTALSVGLALSPGNTKPVNDTPRVIIHQDNRPFIIRHIEQKYAVRIILDHSSNTGKLRYEPSDFSSIFLNALDRHLSRYPRFLLRESGLKNIYLVNNLQYHTATELHDNSCKSTNCWRSQYLYGFKPDGEAAIYIARIKRDKPIEDEECLSTLNHEFFHFIDDLRNKEKSSNIDNAPWKNLNPPRFSYHGEWWNEHTKRYKKQFWEIIWLADMAGLKSENEDQALLFEILTSKKNGAKLLKRLKHDAVLKKKVEIITGCEYDTESQQFIRTLDRQDFIDSGYPDANYFLAWSRGVMDHHWWNAHLDAINHSKEDKK